ncbi:MAG TPA: ABC transporter permease, partial [Candidatus Paceibacterota bacterium]
LLMLAVGYAIGFRIHGTISDAMTAFAILLLFGFAFSWVSACVGLLVRNIETAQVAGFIWVFPLVFASSVFVPVETMPNWLAAFAELNPVTVTVDAVRALLLGSGDVASRAGGAWAALAYAAGIVALFSPVAVYLYRRDV